MSMDDNSTTGTGRPVTSRRSVLRTAASLGITALVGGVLVPMSPREAFAARAKLRTLTEDEAATLAAVAETIVPGAAEAGVAFYVDHHLTVPYEESFLMARYLDVPAPYIDFYRPALAAMDAHVRGIAGRRMDAIARAQRMHMIERLQAGEAEGWQGPPPPYFFFAVRGDAVDVTWGTMEGFEKLGVPYMAHIEPPTPW